MTEAVLPHDQITPIPNNEPDATPSLWNQRYTEIDENFSNLHQRALSAEDEIKSARLGEQSLSVLMQALREQVGGIGDSLSSLASPASVQSAVSLDWLYRNRRVAFELFASGYTLLNHSGVQVLQGINGDDSLDVVSTAGININEDYLLVEDSEVSMVRPTVILTGSRMRLSANLGRAWSANARLCSSTLTAHPAGGVSAKIGDQWISKVVNLGDDRTSRAIVIRRQINAGEVKLYFRDAYTKEWTERPWSMRRSGGGSSGIPDGFADYEYIVSLRSDGYLRIEITGENMLIKHIVGLGGVTGLGGYTNPVMSPVAPVMTAPAAAAVNVIETPTLYASAFSSPAGNEFASAQFQISTASDFATVLHDVSGVKAQTYSVPTGVLAKGTQHFVRVRYTDVAGLVSNWSAVTSFTTKATYAYVNTPSVASPTIGQADLPEKPTLQSVAFAATGQADTHAASQWQIRLASNTWATVLHDSGESAVSLTSYAVPAGVLLDGQQQYVVRVRHKGAALGFSEWSSDIAFSTKQMFASILGIVLATSGGGAGNWQRVDDKFNAITTNAATFANHPTYAGVVDQTIDGQAMVKVPKFYAKAGVVPSGPYAGKRYWMVSDQPSEGFELHPAFMSAGAAIEQFWLGKYQSSIPTGLQTIKKLQSIQDGLASPISLSYARQYAEARNVDGITGFGVWNIYQLAAIQLLALIELGSPDTQTLLGRGNVSSSTYYAVNHPTVIAAAWRGITGLWGNAYQWIEGLKQLSGGKYSIWDKLGGKVFTEAGPMPADSGYPVTFSTNKGALHDLSMLFLPATVGSREAGSIPDQYRRQNTGNTDCLVGGPSLFTAGEQGLFLLEFSYSGSVAIEAANQTSFTRLAKI